MLLNYTRSQKIFNSFMKYFYLGILFSFMKTLTVTNFPTFQRLKVIREKTVRTLHIVLKPLHICYFNFDG